MIRTGWVRGSWNRVIHKEPCPPVASGGVSCLGTPWGGRFSPQNLGPADVRSSGSALAAGRAGRGPDRGGGTVTGRQTLSTIGGRDGA